MFIEDVLDEFGKEAEELGIDLEFMTGTEASMTYTQLSIYRALKNEIESLRERVKELEEK
jgi:hypothetical protein